MAVKPYANRYLKKRLFRISVIALFVFAVFCISVVSIFLGALCESFGLKWAGILVSWFLVLVASCSLSVIALSPWIFLEVARYENMFQKRYFLFTRIILERSWIVEHVIVNIRMVMSHGPSAGDSERLTVEGEVDGDHLILLSSWETAIFGITKIPIVDD